ncbi:MAG: CPBP family intramembrane metalloprotease [Candidatus Cloacimonetes bacterium]|nr:CPBP family intramembrane metalloprotease [Candidatus Cloacimonadota bacterium]
MNFKKAIIVFRKEILEMLRDKRTLFATIVLPVILYPLIFIGTSSIMSRQADIIEKRGATIALLDSLSHESPDAKELYETVLQTLSETPYVTTLEDPPHLEMLYEEKEILAVVSISDTLSAAGVTSYRADVRFDASGDQGRMLFEKLQKSLGQVNSIILAKRLSEKGLEEEYIHPLTVRQFDSSSTEKKMGSILGMLLPYMMILMLITGAAVVAADLVAGEKERHTLETLLVSSATRSEIVLGKYLTVFCMAMINVVINLISISFSVRYLLSQMGMADQGLHLPIKSFIILLFAMVPMATLFSALLLSISTFSRNMKEARTYEQPIMMVSMLMGMASFIPSMQISNLLSLIPVINISLLFKAILIGEWELSHLLITIGSTLVLDILAIWLTVKLFHTEAVLFRTEDDGSSLKSQRKSKSGFFNTFNGAVYFSLALVALYYLGTKWQMADLVNGLIKTQMYIIVLPVFVILAFLKVKGSEARKLLRVKAPKPKELLLVPLIAVSAAVTVSIVAQLINQVFPFPQDYLEGLGKLFNLDVPIWQMFLVIAVMPGICEELMFRGFLIRFFEKGKFWQPVIISALLFALFHLDPFRFIPVLILGILLGYLSSRSGSIINSMLSHTINNSLALFIGLFAEKSWMKFIVVDAENLRYWVIAPALVILALSLWAFHRVTRENQASLVFEKQAGSSQEE